MSKDASRPKDTIAAGHRHTVGLKSDSTVTAVGWNKHDQCDVSDWRDIVTVAAGCAHTLGLKLDGTVVAVGDNEYGQCDVSRWRGIQLPGN
jgi:alpha-tubulin suppressor-like RCC1 family protein